MHDLFPSIRRPARRLGLLLGGVLGAMFAAGQPVQALVIKPLFDAAWLNPVTGAPAAATADVNAVIAEYQGLFINPVTITIQFDWGNIQGSALPANALGVASFPQTPPPNFFNTNPANQYSLNATKGFLAADSLANPQNAALATAVAHLPAAYACATCTNQPPTFFIPDTQFLALTNGAQNADPIEAFTGFGTNPGAGWDFTGGTPTGGKFDFTSTLEHEIAHAMGRVDDAFIAGGPKFLTALDFYKYTCGTGTNNPNFVASCFSIDGGTTDLQTFDSTSDSSDWATFPCNGTDSFDNCTFPNTRGVLSAVDIIEMEALGYDPPAVPEPGTLALLGTSLLGLAALRRRRRQ